MLILSLYGSPRRDGFSSAIHDEFLSPLDGGENQLITKETYKLKINPCTACGKCRDISSCIFDDDMTEIYSLIRKADILTVSCPLYFSSFPSPLKALMDRCQLLWEEERRGEYPEKHRKGFFISTGGSEYNSMFTGVLTGIRHFFNILQFNFSNSNSILLHSTDRMDKISLDLLKEYRNTGKWFFNLCSEKKHSGEDSG